MGPSNRIVTFQTERHFPLNHGAMGERVQQLWYNYGNYGP